MSEDLVAVGKIVGSQGLKGEVKVIPLTDHPQRFKTLKKVQLVLGQRVIETEVEKGREQKNIWVIKLKNFNSLEEVKELKNSYLMIPREERMTLPQDHFYIDDLIGLMVYTEENKLGEITDVLQAGGNDVFVVKPEDLSCSKDILIPALKEVIKEVDLREKLVRVKLPEGLLD
ncbi:ribosome maturation factor RimM [Candidatus Contubernalis alkaliaceticus]|uniref:ribosome maturation factor RimM n=1 Tax=Candidatus Contubernalis alkaliaceticus TaxID=338645 RepID=UPI001F4C4770|nr:ribosome maturation factor RimM [Candidatus Contubernalis alkalaceticus]UNC92743.1 16S rRNA processing protein RimM [Candidatus Contubernalis alkalaceticus]